MNWKRIGRAALCLLVVCCLILNMSPLQARATAVVLPAAPVVAAVPGLNVVAAILIGLGVLYGVATTDWDGIVNSCAEWLTEQGVIDESGSCKIVKFPDQNGGLPKWFADVALIEMIRGWLFEQEVVTETAGQVGYAYYNGVLLPDIGSVWTDKVTYPYACIGRKSESDFVVAFTNRPLFKSSANSHLYGITGRVTYIRYILSGNEWVYSDSLTETAIWAISNDYPPMWANFDVLAGDKSTVLITASEPVSAGSTIDSSYDVSLGDLATSDTAIADGYATWAENATTVTGSTIVGSEDEEITVFPLGLGQTWEDTRDLTQEDVWAGTSTYEDTSTDTGTDTEPITGTFADTAVGTFVDSLIDALMTPFQWLVDALLAGIQAIFVPSEDFITEKVQALRAEFGFADSIMSTGEAIGAALNDFDTSPPIIYMELGNAESQYNWGGRAVALDLRWYERYKPTVDQLLSALLYLWFAWRVFRRLPGIISGVDGDIPDVSVHDGAFRGYASSLPRLGSGSMKWRD